MHRRRGIADHAVDARLVDQVESEPGNPVDSMLAGMDRTAEIWAPWVSGSTESVHAVLSTLRACASDGPFNVLKALP